MPRIPIFEQSNQILPDAPPGADIAGGSPIAEAASQFGNQMNQIGFQVAMKRKQAEDEDYAFNEGLKAKSRVEIQSLQLKLETPGGEGYTEKVSKLLKDEMEQGQKNAQNETQRRLFERAVGQDFEQIMLRSNSYEKKLASESRVLSLSDRIDEVSKIQVELPDDIIAIKRISEIDQAIDQNLDMFPEQKAELKLRNKNKIGYSTIDGYLMSKDPSKVKLAWDLLNGKNTPIANRNVDPDYALRQGLIDEGERDLLKKEGKDYQIDVSWGPDYPGVPQRSIVLDGLSPEEKSTLLKRARNLLERKSESTIADYKIRKDNFNTGAIKNGPPNKDELNAMVKNAASVYAGKTLRRDTEIFNLTAHYVVGSVLSSMKGKTNEEINNADLINFDDISKQVKDLLPNYVNASGPNFGIGQVDVIVNAIRNGKEDLINAREKDAVASIADDRTTNPTLFQKKISANTGLITAVQDFDRSIVLEQQRLGVQNIRVIDDKKLKEYSDRLEGMNNYWDKTAYLQELQKQHGNYFSYVLKDLARKKTLPQDVEVAAWMDNPDTQIAILKSGLNKGLDSQENLKANKIKPDDISALVREGLSDLTGAIKASSRDGVSGGAEILKLEGAAKRTAMDLMESGKYSESEAVERAVSLINSEFEVVGSSDSFSFSGQSNGIVFYKKEIDGVKIDKNRVSHYMWFGKLKQELSSLDLLVPPPDKGQEGLFTDTQRKDRLIEKIRKDGFWKTNADQSGLNLWYYGDNGVPVQVLQLAPQPAGVQNGTQAPRPSKKIPVGETFINITRNPKYLPESGQ